MKALASLPPVALPSPEGRRLPSTRQLLRSRPEEADKKQYTEPAFVPAKPDPQRARTQSYLRMPTGPIPAPASRPQVRAGGLQRKSPPIDLESFGRLEPAGAREPSDELPIDTRARRQPEPDAQLDAWCVDSMQDLAADLRGAPRWWLPLAAGIGALVGIVALVIIL